MPARTQQRQDVYQQVTQQIVAAIESGAGTWRMPWMWAQQPQEADAGAG